MGKLLMLGDGGCMLATKDPYCCDAEYSSGHRLVIISATREAYAALPKRATIDRLRGLPGVRVERDDPTDAYLNRVEWKIYDAQEPWIRKRFGKKAADAANYGWFVDVTETTALIQTKVYGHGFLSSSATYPSTRVMHSWLEA